MTGHAIPAISLDDLARVLVPIPPVEVQQKIAAETSTMLAMRKDALRTGEKIVEATALLIERLS